MNGGPLSDATFCGRPYLANNDLSTTVVVAFAVVLDLGKTSVIFNSCLPPWNVFDLFTSPKSMWIHCHGYVTHGHNKSGTAFGDIGVSAQSGHDLTVSSISISSPGHQTNDLVKAFIRHIPGWFSCNSTSMCPCSGDGITTRLSHNTHTHRRQTTRVSDTNVVEWSCQYYN